MLELSNETDWSAGLYAGWNEDRQSQISCIMKRGFSFDQNGDVKPLEETPGIIEVDEYYTKPHESSLKQVSELSSFKQGSETYLYGTAYPEDNKYAMEVEYSIVFNDGKRWTKVLRISGKRSWNKIMLGYVMSKPEILQPTQIKYENAFGGYNPENEKESFSYNPIGKGFNKASGWKVMNLELPSIEIGPKFLKSPPQQQIPAGFSPLPIYWEPRKKELGEIHPNPEEQGGCPYTAQSKSSLHNVAPLDQRFPMPFIGGEKIRLKGFFNSEESNRIIEFEVPKLNFDISIVLANKKTKLFPVFDTIIINTDKLEFYVICRLGIAWDILDTRNGWVMISEKKIINQSLPNDITRNYA
ncbi:MAG: DUF2169 domain-containing protein [Gammaproteobacteria bacterium]